MLLPLYKQIYLFGDDGYFERLADEIRLAAREKFGSESGERVKVFFGQIKSGADKFERRK